MPQEDRPLPRVSAAPQRLPAPTKGVGGPGGGRAEWPPPPREEKGLQESGGGQLQNVEMGENRDKRDRGGRREECGNEAGGTAEPQPASPRGAPLAAQHGPRTGSAPGGGGHSVGAPPALRGRKPAPGRGGRLQTNPAGTALHCAARSAHPPHPESPAPPPPPRSELTSGLALPRHPQQRGRRQQCPEQEQPPPGAAHRCRRRNPARLTDPARLISSPTAPGPPRPAPPGARSHTPLSHTHSPPPHTARVPRAPHRKCPSSQNRPRSTCSPGWALREMRGVRRARIPQVKSSGQL
ncbi:basic salivary proline-rich protein 3-like [Neopelma chrysocephalum]|uniref:basic salivary proline-rich protein 3-like n=1 Tax=Neopelma chrysocephalum TaxID=114329 RepID=UPI000FCD1C16|nr:basic salivary proline-rich protein 3-like [Neopelma chrysocephalum]